ncbi:MAG TPA: hypothetical protein VK993_16990, partial [Chthoniobacterales bacterium]|nr:hypothetical protein [Chthoniobacterales bacterium]
MGLRDKRAAVRPLSRWIVCCAITCGAVVALAGCNRMVAPRSTQTIKDADARAADGDFLHAINLYESALDGSAGSAEIHYKLAL